MKYVERYRAKSITIESTERLAWTLDGEEGEPTLVAHIDNYPRALQIYVDRKRIFK